MLEPLGLNAVIRRDDLCSGYGSVVQQLNSTLQLKLNNLLL